ncbi:MAG: hypothetical protein MUF34_37375, partial [Polyangiaceae bacterium]|nr:hypothetical protein [Polyangiaceae bacterium]
MSHRWNVLGLAGMLALALSVTFCSDEDDDPSGNGGAGSPTKGAAGAAPSQGGGGAGPSTPGGAGSGGAGSGGAGSGGAGSGAGGAGASGDVELTAADFGCILDWPKVRGLRVTNKFGPVAPSVDAANQVGTVDYPIGTVIQHVPHEAMVKRRPGFNPAAGDWEFFVLDVSAQGTTIKSRGTTEVANALGSCQGCHVQAERKFDFVCEDDHGCPPLPFTNEQIEA